MKDILIGFIIILACFLVADFIYSEKNICTKTFVGGGTEEYKCGLIKKQFNIDIDFLDRYW